MLSLILFDVDDTLMDYKAAESAVLRRIFAQNGKEADPAALEDLWGLSWHYWDLHQLSQTWREEVQREYHRRYHAAVLAYCAAMREKYALNMEADALYERFNAFMADAVTLYDDALPVLSALQSRFTIGSASNALASSLRARVAAMGIPIEHVFLSEEMGCVKPARAFFEGAARAAGVAPGDCLMVGDSLTSDIAGAAGAGMRTCWINRTGRPLTGGCTPDYIITSLSELMDLDIIKGENHP